MTTKTSRRHKTYILGPLTVPFTVLVDQQEQRRYRFVDIYADANDARHYAKLGQKKYSVGRLLEIPIEVCHLKTGDYTVAGCENQLTIERKSPIDLFGTLSQGRERFKREHERMAEMEYAVVVIEGTWPQMLKKPPWPSKLSPKSVLRTAISWQQRYGVPWLAVGPRRLAEKIVFRILERFFRGQERKERDEN